MGKRKIHKRDLEGLRAEIERELRGNLFFNDTNRYIQRLRAVELFFELHLSAKRTALTLKVSERSVRRWVKRFIKFGWVYDLKDLPRSGRPKKRN